MKMQIALALTLQFLLSGCSKNTSPTSGDMNQFPGIRIAGMTMWDSSTAFISSLQYDDTMCVPITCMNARLVVSEYDKNEIIQPLSDPVMWYTSIGNSISLDRTQDSSVFVINTNALLTRQSSNIVVAVYCRVGSFISNTFYVQVLFNAVRFNYRTDTFSNVFTMSNIKTIQWGREISFSDSAGSVYQVFAFNGATFKMDLYNTLGIFNVQSNVLDDFSYASDTLASFNSTFRGTYTRLSTNQRGTWLLN